MSTRLRLRRADGRIYLDRWGIEWKRLGGVAVHKMTAPDPGIDLHDHPSWFASLILRGGYNEARSDVRTAGRSLRAPRPRVRPRWSLRATRLNECHRITELHKTPTWTLLVHGPNRRKWGFYLPGGWMWWEDYDRTVRAERRDLYADITSSGDPRVQK